MDPRRLLDAMEPWVFLPAAAIVVAFVVAASVETEAVRQAFETLQSALIDGFGWFYLLTATILLGVALWLLASPFGRIRLGGADAEPEFGNLAWFSMLLSAGMGIGIVFFGAAEPLLHYLSPPEAQGGTPDALGEAMRYTFFHWGLHPWAIYVALALPLAYFHFRLGLPLAPRSLLWPLIGERIYGGIGHAVDVLCTVGTLFGVATSLGLGAMQIATGLEQSFGVSRSLTTEIAIIASITGVATISVISGLHRGVQRLSQFNVGLAIVLMAFVLFAGPTVYILETMLTGIGHYLQTLPETSLRIVPGQEDGWQSDWTLFYWSWWISWSPFVGVFVARISKGRTVREFVTTALLVPTLGGFLWFSTFGGASLHAQIEGGVDLAGAVRENTSLALYAVLEQLPFHEATWLLATLLILVFFVTSSDSGSLVDDMVTSGGHPDPPRIQRLFWALAEGTVAALLLYTGGLQALRSASLTTGILISVFLLVAARGLLRALTIDADRRGVPDAKEIAPGED